jgi:RNA polymerase primary sigma factor
VARLAELYLFLEPSISRRALAGEISERIGNRGLSIGIDPMQIALAGRQKHVRREVLEELLHLLAVHELGDEGAATERHRELEPAIQQREKDRTLVPARRVVELARAWKLAHHEPSSRRLGRLLRERLRERDLVITEHRAIEIVDGRTKTVRRACVDVMEELIAESIDGTVDQVLAEGAGDLSWVCADRVAELARKWLDHHPEQSQRKLAIRVAEAVCGMGYETSHNTIQPILGGHKKRCRGFVLRALLEQLDAEPRPALTATTPPPRKRAQTSEDSPFEMSSLGPRGTPLERDEEIALAQVIVRVEHELLERLLAMPAAQPAFAELIDDLSEGRVPGWDIAVDGAQPSDHAEEKHARHAAARALRAGRAAEEKIRLGHRLLRQLTAELPPSEARSLAPAWQRLDDARSKLIAANMHVVHAHAARFHGGALERRDLVQEGCIGLMRAVDKFDHRRGIKFSTYANWWVRQAVQRALSDQARTIRLPEQVVQDAYAVGQAERRFRNLEGRSPSAHELAAMAGVDEAKVTALDELPGQPVSMSTPVHDEDDGATLGDRLADPERFQPLDEAISDELRETVREAVAQLPDRHAWTLRHYYGLENREHTLAELGRHLGVTRERARQIKARGTDILRERYGKRLRPLLDQAG